MELWAHINGKDYAIANGVSLSDELGENLDNGQISLPHVQEILSVKPYDDVIIHDFKPNVSPSQGGLPNRPFHEVITTTNERKTDGSANPFYDHFYRHMLAWTISREQVNLSDTVSRTDEDGLIYNSLIFNYTISLISETKGLEAVPMPNKSITQPKGTTSTGLESSQEEKASTDRMGYSIPFGIVSKDNDGLFLGESSPHPDDVNSLYNWKYVARLMANDNDTSTTDMCSFTYTSKNIATNSTIILPDWCISSGTVVVYKETYFVIGNILKSYSDYRYNVEHPIKHWAIRQRTSADTSAWSRSDALKYVEDYINSGTNHNNQFIAHLKSSSPVANKSMTFSSEGTYDIFLYCTPNVFNLSSYGINTQSNIFGMVPSSSGATTPDSDSRFLVCWTIHVSANSNMADVMTIYEATREAVQLYSPYVKVTDYGKTWRYERKYALSSNLSSFKSFVAPEMTLNLPSLRDYLNQLFRTKDCLPVVHDGVIDTMSLSQRKGSFAETGINWVQNSLDGSSYSDRLVRNYSNALSKDSIVKCVERIGFRNSSSATMTLANMRLETAHEIYKITKVYMEYYKECDVTSSTKYTFLCRQDITPLVLLNSQRNLLSVDWESFGVGTLPTTMDEMSKYKFCTVGYDIGSKYITGWGTAYTYISDFFFSQQKAYIQNIYDFCNTNTPMGVDLNVTRNILPLNKDYSTYGITTSAEAGAEPTAYTTSKATTVATITASDGDYFFNSTTEKLRSMMFLVEYEGFISANIQASKDYHDGDVYTRDNQSSSLSYVESDGVNQKEKANRLGNYTVVAHSRLADMSQANDIGSVWDSPYKDGQEQLHKDEVVYKRTFMIYKDYIDVTYYLCRDYVLRNYFTSVYSKERPFSLASYEESVKRLENKNLQIIFSADASYYQTDSKQIGFNYESLSKTISFFSKSIYTDDGILNTNKAINASYTFIFPDSFGETGYSGAFIVDSQNYVSGYSLCVTITMVDNVSAGVYISKWNPTFGNYVWALLGNVFSTSPSVTSLTYAQSQAMDDVTGAKQTWYMFPVNKKTGQLYKVHFGTGFFTQDNRYLIGGTAINNSIPDSYFNSARRLPFIRSSIKEVDSSNYLISDYSSNSTYDTEGKISTDSSAISDGSDNINEFASAKFVASPTELDSESPDVVFKDGKELISTTLQLEPISDTPNIMFSEYMMGLSDVLSIKEKRTEDLNVPYTGYFKTAIVNKRYTYQVSGGIVYSDLSCTPCFTVYLNKEFLKTLSSTPVSINKKFSWSGKDCDGNDISFSLTINSISSFAYDESKGINKIFANISYAYSRRTYSGGGVEQCAMYDSTSYSGSLYGVVSDAYKYSASEYAPKNDDSSYSSFTLIFDLYSNPSRSTSSDVDDDMFYRWNGFIGNNVDGYYFLSQESYGIYDFSVLETHSEAGDSTRTTVLSDDYVQSDMFKLSTISISKDKNLYWSLFPSKMSMDTPFVSITDEDINQSGVSVQVSKDSSGKPILSLKLSQALSTSSQFASLRLYYLEDNVYHFVFGINLLPLGSTSTDGLLPASDGLTYTVYLSYMDSRSKTVWDATTGDPTYRIANYVKDTGVTYGTKNDCLLKKS